MARHTARGLLGILFVTLLAGLLPAAPASRPPLAADAKGYISLAQIGRHYGLKVTAKDQGASLTLVGGTLRLEFSAGTREAAWNGYRLFLGDGPVMRGRALSLSRTDWNSTVRPLVDPDAMAAPGQLRLILVDPGHGGTDPGTVNSRLKMQEKTYSLDVARRLAQVLLKKGYRVLLTRTSDVRLKPTQADDLRARADKANRAGADIFISLHFNSLPGNSTVRGIETYVLTPAGQRSTAAAARRPSDRTAYTGNRHDHWNAALAGAVHHRLVGGLAATDRGLKRARFAVLRPVNCPAVLVEGGFLSNTSEAKKIRSSVYRQKMAEAIGAGIGDYAVQLRSASIRKSKL